MQKKVLKRFVTLVLCGAMAGGMTAAPVLMPATAFAANHCSVSAPKLAHMLEGVNVTETKPTLVSTSRSTETGVNILPYNRKNAAKVGKTLKNTSSGISDADQNYYYGHLLGHE